MGQGHQQFVDETQAQHALGFGSGDAPGLQVELLHGIELADGGAVGTFHIVVVDFQLRLGVDFRPGVE